MKPTSDIAFSPAVKAIQQQYGSRKTYERVEQGHGWANTVTPELEDFLSELDMFYLSTANSDGQPYIQYRGGPKGFLKAIDNRTLGFADFSGNRQYISVGNLSENPKAFIFLMDYANQRRIKIWGNARIELDDQELLAKLTDPAYPAQVERAVLFEIEAWDINCRQHIHRRFDEASVAENVKRLQDRISELETALESVQK